MKKMRIFLQRRHTEDIQMPTEIFKKQKVTSNGKDVDKGETLYTVGRN
jgi:hypothetical protein